VTRATETKPAYKTTEFLAYLGAVAAVVIAGAVTDSLGARDVWLFVTVLTAGYMLSRGLAKSGSYERERHDDDDD
jgi:sugar phosphate permease